MNIKTVFAILSICLAWAQSAIAQYIPTVAEGKTWTIRLDYGRGSYRYTSYHLSCDTLINGKTYLLIRDSHKVLGFTREDTVDQEIFYLPLNSEDEIRLATFKKEIGDTVHIFNVELEVLDVQYVEIWGEIRKVIVMLWPWKFIEGVGVGMYGVYPVGMSWPFPSMSNLEPMGPICGDTATTAVSMVDLQGLDVFPNPFSNIIEIINPTNQILTVSVTDVLGNIMHVGRIYKQNSINTELWPPGVYFLMCNNQIYKLLKV